MGFRTNGPGCGCCTDPCTIGTDTFDTDLSQFATTGSPSVSAGSLLMSPGDRVIFTPEPATDDDGVRVQTFPLTADATATMRLIAAWTDANNYLFGELSIAASAGMIRLGRLEGGASSWLTDAETLEDTGAELNDRSTATMCWQPGQPTTPVALSVSGFAGAGFGTSWSAPDSVTSPSGTHAEFSAASTVTTETLTANTFGFAIPPGSTIDGIGVSALIEHDGMDTDYVDSLVSLVDRTGTGVGDNKATGLSLNSFETNVGWGDDTDDWNAGLTWADIIHPNFGVIFQFTNNGNAGNIRVRGVAIGVWFTTPDRKAGHLTLSYGNTATPNTKQCVKAMSIYDADGLKTGISVSAGDWDFTTYEVKYLVSASRPTCPDCGDDCSVEEGPPCDCCDPAFPAAESYLLDLGAGGWTDAGCGYCNEVTGQYVLEAADDCRWVYFEAMDDCPGHPCACADTRVLAINLWLHRNEEDECFWDLTVAVYSLCDPTEPDPSACGSGARFQSAPLASLEDCQDMPVELIKVSDATDYDCNGALPAIVDLDTA